MTDPTYNEAIKAKLKERDSIVPLIDSMRAGSYSSEHTTEALNQIPVGDATAKELWNKDLKTERAALQAMFITEIWPLYEQNRAQRRDEYVSQARIEQEGGADTILTMQVADAKAFEDTLALWMRKQNTAAGPLAAAYTRFVQLADFGKKHGLLPKDADPGTLMLNGFGTAANTAWSLIELVPRLAKEAGVTLSEPEMIEAIRSGYGPMIAIHMNLNEEVGNGLLRQMMKQDDWYSPQVFRSEFFSLKKIAKDGIERWALVLNHEKAMALTDESGDPILSKIPFSATTGCPAAYTARDGINVMQRYFDQAIEDAKKEYFPWAPRA